MIGIIVTGHGEFASGVTSAVNLIAGEQTNYQAINFDGSSTIKLEEDLKKAIRTMQNLDGIIVLADLVGGSPFKTAVLASQNMNNVYVIGGANLAMLCELCIVRTFQNDVVQLKDQIINTGKEGVLEFKMPVKQEVIEEGI